MSIFLTIIFSVPLLTVLWWLWAHRRLRGLPHAHRWQVGVAISSSLFLFVYVWMIAARLTEMPVRPHAWLMAFLMMWGMIFLPFLAVPSMLGWSVWRGGATMGRFITRIRRGKPAMGATGDDERLPDDEAFTRRQMIGAAIVTFPMIASLGATAYSIPQKRTFRVRDIHVPIERLPEALDGVRIAHISDTHVGTFTRGEVLDRIVAETSRLHADMVLMTGDLINQTTNDMPEAMRMMKRLMPQDRLVMIEGNHDLFEGRDAFVSVVRDHGVRILLDESHTLRVRGYPVQLLGIQWHFRAWPIATHVDRVAGQRDPDAFPILLAHHPHAFDRAAELGLPLTLAGHTHGGQLMLTSEFGAGPAMFKYWSGLYQREASSLIVSNGAGNWFPLRTNAPAEIVHVILQRV